MESAAPVDSRIVYSVSRLNQEVRQLLEGSFPLLWIEGEISNFARPASGHCYFTLKDAEAQVRCAMFRQRTLQLRFTPKNGDQVLVRAQLSLYTPRGDYQLIVEHMEEAGDGALRRAFELLKAKLQREGLFDPARKRPLPALPRRLGVITSPTGAAIRDVLTVLRRRFPALPVLIYPVPVQGADAPEKIAAAIRLASERAEVDCLLLTRGGGSLEDLWAFNEEVVARAIADCRIPVVSAVGHEIDFTIADFVADRRAPTPSAAAELLSPDGQAWLAQFQAVEQRLERLLRQRLERLRERVGWLRRHLEQHHPQRRLQDAGQRLDELEQRLIGALRRRLRELDQRRQHLHRRLLGCGPQQTLQLGRQRCADLEARLRSGMLHQLREKQAALAALARQLDAVSPLGTLNRGFALVRREEDGAIVRHVDSVAVGERITATLADGTLRCRVEAKEPSR